MAEIQYRFPHLRRMALMHYGNSLMRSAKLFYHSHGNVENTCECIYIYIIICLTICSLFYFNYLFVLISGYRNVGCFEFKLVSMVM